MNARYANVAVADDHARSHSAPNTWLLPAVTPFVLAALLWSTAARAQEEVKDSTSLDAGSATLALPAPTQASVDASETRPGTAPGRVAKPTSPVVAAGTPFALGSFLVYPEFDASWNYDDNVYYSANGSKLSDSSWIYSPAIWVQSNWAKHALNFHAAADATRYSTYSAENSNDYRVSGEGRRDFSADTNVYGGFRFSQDHEDRESPSARNGLTPTKYTERRFYGGFFRQMDRVSLRVAGTAQHLSYEDVDFLSGSGVVKVINNDDRRRWQYSGGVRLGYELSPRLEPYVQVALDNRRYDDAVDDLGYARDSDGQRYLAGVRWNVPRKLRLDAFVGRLHQDYSDARFSDVNVPVAGAALEWSVAERTTISASLDRTVEETTVSSTPSPGVLLVSSSYVNTFTSVGIQHRFSDRFSVRGDGSLSRVAYQGIDRTDDYYGLLFGFVYRIQKNLFVDVSLSHRKLNSSVPGEDFEKNVLMVRLAIPFSH